MQHKRLKLSIVFLLGLGLIGLAQESVNVTGGNASGKEGSTSYSLGHQQHRNRRFCSLSNNSVGRQETVPQYLKAYKLSCQQ